MRFKNFIKMKKLVVLVLFLGLGTYVQAQETINWVTFNEALDLQKKKPKKIFMDVYTDWCGPCKMLDKQTFQNADVIKYINENYYAVKFNAEGTESVTYQGKTFTNPRYVEGKTGRNSMHQFTASLRVSSYPSMLFFDETATLIQPVRGFLKPKQLEIFLKIFATDDYKKFDTTEKWQEYQANFVGTFKE